MKNIKDNQPKTTHAKAPEKHYVKFYSVSDWATGHELMASKEALGTFDENNPPSNINDVLELFNVARYIDADVAKLTNWSQKEILTFQSMSGRVHKAIDEYFINLRGNEIKNIVPKIRFDYQEDFILLFGKHKLGEKISEKDFSQLVSRHEPLPLRHVLRSKYMVAKFPNAIKNALLADPRNAELLMDEQIARGGKEHKIHIPENISETEVNKLVSGYIDLPQLMDIGDHKEPGCNPNYLQVIPRLQKKGMLKLSDATKLKAKKRYDDFAKDMFTDCSITTHMRIGLYSSHESLARAKEQQTHNKKGGAHEYFYDDWIDSEWLKSNTDWATVGNNFIYVLKLFLPDMQMVLPSHPSELGVLEGVFGLKTKRQYKKGQATELKWYMALLKMQMYRSILADNKIKIEKFLPWFFGKYLKSNFQIKNYHIDKPLLTGGYQRRIKSLLPELDRILKEYKLLAENGEIDDGLLGMMHDTLFFADIPSKNEKKYVYFNENDNDVGSMAHLLYSDQAGMACLKDHRTKENLVQLIISEHPDISDFHDHQIRNLNRLKDKGVLSVNEAGEVIISDIVRVKIIKDIFDFGGIAYHHVHPIAQATIESMLANRELVAESSLFSRSEADYLDYMLNDSKFDDGPSIRNRYLHGSTSGYSEQQHEQNYLTLILIFIMIIVKINDDLCISDGETGMSISN